MPGDVWQRGEDAAQEALGLAVDLRDDLPAAWRRLTRLRASGALGDVAVALAAMVPLDVPAGELLAWTDDLAPGLTPRQAYDRERWQRRCRLRLADPVDGRKVH